MKPIALFFQVVAISFFIGCASDSTTPTVSIERTNDSEFPFLLRISWMEVSRFNPHSLQATRSEDQLTTYVFITHRIGTNTDGEFAVNYVASPRNPRVSRGKIILTSKRVRIDLQAAKAEGFGFSRTQYEPFIWNGSYELKEVDRNPSGRDMK